MLELKDVSKGYRQADQFIPVLNKMNMQARAGETLAIMGKSGSGKSTLLSIISGLLKPDNGDILFKQKSLTRLDENRLADWRAQSLGFIFQNFQLVSYLDALENVMLPAKICQYDNAANLARELLSQVALSKRLRHLPHQLSGGEKQRVAIARALIHKPQLILADEPSGSLDQQTGEEIMDLLFGLADKMQTTLIVVTHEEKVANRCDRQLRIENGQLYVVNS